VAAVEGLGVEHGGEITRASSPASSSELANFQRTLKQMLTVIEEGGQTRGMTERMREFEAR
jgi:hypothetical protein